MMGHLKQSRQPEALGQYPTDAALVNPNRLSLPFSLRLTYAALGGFATGLFLGVSHGSSTAGMRFRAENAHRFPTTQKGWYLYHKSKNYHMMLGGLKEGFKMTPKLSLWIGSLFVFEEAVDRIRSQQAGRHGQEDFLSTTAATLTLAGVWSLWSMCFFPRFHV